MRKKTGKTNLRLGTAPPKAKSGKDKAAGKEDDDETPLTKPGSPAARGQVTPFKKDDDKPIAPGAGEGEKQQGELVEVEDSVKNPPIVGKKIKATLNKPKFDRTKNGERLIVLPISFVMVKEHKELLYDRICVAWDDMAKNDWPSLEVNRIPAQRAVFFLTHDTDETLELQAAKFSHGALQVIEETGTGSAKKVIRFAFRLTVLLTDDVLRFASQQFDQTIYLTLEDSQEELFEDGEEEE